MLVAISCVSKWKFTPAQPSDNPHEITADFKRALLWISWKDWEQKVHHTVWKSKEYDQRRGSFSFVSHKNTSEWISETSKFSYFFVAFLYSFLTNFLKVLVQKIPKKDENFEVSEIRS